MKTKTRSIQQIIEEQVQKWNIMRTEKREEKADIPVITISREAGSGGQLVAKGIAKRLGFDLFHREVIQEMAESAQVNSRLLETLDEKGLSMLEDWVSSLVHERHLWPDQYLQHLMKVIATIGRHGRAIIVGRGANFVLPPGKRFRVRIVAPQELRVQNVARDLDIPVDEAKWHIIRTNSDRRAFIRKYFNADISDPINYDLVINTETLSVDAAISAVCSAIKL